jgi:hypothetical protein
MSIRTHMAMPPKFRSEIFAGDRHHRSCSCARGAGSSGTCEECHRSGLQQSSWRQDTPGDERAGELPKTDAWRAPPGGTHDFRNLAVFPPHRDTTPSYQAPGDAGTPAPPAPAPAAAGLGTGAISGGVKGLTMNVTGKFTPCTDCKDGLEVIQVFWGTRRTDGVKVGKTTTTFPPLAADYDTFVDGGKNSPGGAVYTGDHPYYIGRPDLPKSYGYVGGQGSAGSVSGCSANPTDAPGAAALHQEAYFETVFACLNFQGGGKDKLIDSFQWGFTGLGKTFKPSPYSSATDIVKNSTPTAKFLATLKADYSGYSFV